MMDSLHISALRIETHIGVHAWEQRILQTLLLDIKIPMDFSNCNNELTNTIDYATLCHDVTHYVESNAFILIETVAENVVKLIKDTFHIKHVSVSVSKPNAIKNAGNICVTVNR